MLPGWQNLSLVREKLGLTMRDIETATQRIASKHNNEEYSIPISRLSDFETKGVIPGIYRLYSLAAIYRLDFRQLLSWYGVELDLLALDFEAAAPPMSHLTHCFANTRTVQ